MKANDCRLGALRDPRGSMALSHRDSLSPEFSSGSSAEVEIEEALVTEANEVASGSLPRSSAGTGDERDKRFGGPIHYFKC